MNQSLANKVFISTRPKDQNDDLRSLFVNEGAEFIEMPTIEIKPNDLTKADIYTIKQLHQFTWIVFTSPNGIKYFFEKLKEINGNSTLPNNIKIAVIGIKSNSILEQYGYKSTLQNNGNTGVDLANSLLKMMNKDDHILFPEGNIARGTINKMLSKYAKCTNLVVYRNTRPAVIDEHTIDRICQNEYDQIIVTSPSGYQNLIEVLKDKTKIEDLRITCIGTTTETAITDLGYTPVLTAKMSNASGIFQELKNHYNNQ